MIIPVVNIFLWFISCFTSTYFQFQFLLVYNTFYDKQVKTLEELLGKTEAYVAPARRVAAVPIRRTTVRRVVEPTASAIHTARARQRTSWIRLRGTAIVTTAVPVLTPLPYVATHVIKSQLVWFITPFMTS